ncbi:MAG: hypothetical protein RUMPE_01349 [Eubacteriales bacterium SKADARSKE-1]|nr:hypothetical protein [Eubacteriales bacterium SKADARSKE-1]MDQ5984302.1 hypothetical protein [Eubacteriales bacterium SKADARSKE-1]
MKKLISIFLIILTLAQCANIISYAECSTPTINLEEINFEDTLSDVSWVTQNLGDKEVLIVRFEYIRRLQSYLYDNIKHLVDDIKFIERTQKTEIKDVWETMACVLIAEGIVGSTMFLGWKTIQWSGSKVRNLIKFLKGYCSSTKSKDKDILNDNSNTSLCSTNVNQQKGISLSEKVKIVAIFATEFFCLGSILSGLVYLNNKFIVDPKIEKNIEKDNGLIDQYQILYYKVKDAILKNEWIGKNVLIMAIPTDPKCKEADARFDTVEGIKYKKSQAAIDWDFAYTECQFLGKGHGDCQQEVMKTIDCIRESGNCT